MKGFLALFAFSLWLIWLFSRDEKERALVSHAAWIVLAWAVIHGTRPVTSWFAGVDTEIAGPESRDEGNPVDASIDLCLIIVGLIVLGRRGIRLSVVVRENTWLFVLYVFWLTSVSWSDYPLITFKRVFRDLGNVVMMLVVLTELEPGEAIRAVCARLAYVSIPLSILLYRYFPEWGRVYVGYNADTQMFVGVTTHKNTLGVLALVAAVFLLWDLLEIKGKHRSTVEKFSIGSRTAVLLMCWYLLLTIDSVTSLVCAVLGSALLITLKMQFVRSYPGRIELFGLGIAAFLWIVDSVFNVTEAFLQNLGRDMSLTSRTDLWAIVKDYQDNPLVGAGFNTFWSGARYTLLAESTHSVVQAHNGYLEIYLNGGVIGVGLLVVLLFSAYWRIRKQLVSGIPEGTMRFVVLLVAIVHNNSEASFNKVGLLWLVTLFAIMQYRMQLPLRQGVSVAMR